MESNGQSKITKWKQSHGYREQTNSCQRRRVWGLVGRVKGLSKEKKGKTHGYRQYHGHCQREVGGQGRGGQRGSKR